ncbi:MAG: hypothetical protein K6C98_08965 [Treponema sp.]|nr:hypothetical protein [Treponema sp.]
MQNRIDNQKVLQKVKNISIFLVVIAVFSFFIGSNKIYHFSEKNPVMYAVNYNRLSNTGKHLADSMKKTCEVQERILGPTRGNGNGGSKFFDEVSRRNRK